MLIEELEYKWHKYEIHLHKSRNNDRIKEHENKFEIKSNWIAHKISGYFDSFNEADNKVKEVIDKREEERVDNWFEAVEECIIQTHYEDRHLDEKMIETLLEKYKKQVIEEYEFGKVFTHTL